MSLQRPYNVSPENIARAFDRLRFRRRDGGSA